MRLSQITNDVMLYSIGELCNGGYLRIYGGNMPKSAEKKAENQSIVELRFPTPAFRSPDRGVITSTSSLDAIISSTGKATWFRVSNSLGQAILDGTVGTAGADLNLTSIDFELGAKFTLDSFTIAI